MWQFFKYVILSSANSKKPHENFIFEFLQQYIIRFPILMIFMTISTNCNIRNMCHIPTFYLFLTIDIVFSEILKPSFVKYNIVVSKYRHMCMHYPLLLVSLLQIKFSFKLYSNSFFIVIFVMFQLPSYVNSFL